MKYRYVVEFETSASLTAQQRNELRTHLDVQLESLSDGTIAAIAVSALPSSITAIGEFTT
jgi:hypothetical protein